MKFDNSQYILRRLFEEFNENKFLAWVSHINYFKKYKVVEEISIDNKPLILRLEREMAPKDRHILILGDIRQIYNDLFELSKEQVDIEEYLETGEWVEKDWSDIIAEDNLSNEKYGNKYDWLRYIYESQESIILMPFGLGENKFDDSLDVYGVELDMEFFGEFFVEYKDYDIYLQKLKRILYKTPPVRERFLKGELIYMPYLFGPELIFYPFV